MKTDKIKVLTQNTIRNSIIISMLLFLFSIGFYPNATAQTSGFDGGKGSNQGNLGGSSFSGLSIVHSQHSSNPTSNITPTNSTTTTPNNNTTPTSNYNSNNTQHYYSPPAKSEKEIRDEKDAKDLKEASDDEVDKGNKCYYNHDWVNAIKYYKAALDYDPDNDDAIFNLKMVEINQTFFRSINENSEHYKNQLQKLSDDISKIYVPSPTTNTIHEGIILGLMNTQEINDVKMIRSPFTGKEYKKGEYFATSDGVSLNELLRGVLDNSYLGEYTLNTDWGKKLIGELKGTHFDILFAHSNGATVSEALIRKGIISVDELNILGGDRSLINDIGYKDMIASGLVKKVVVWINPGDPIPYGTTAGLFSPLIGARNQYIKAAADYFSFKLTGESQGGDAIVEYRILKGPQYGYIGQEFVFGREIFNAHGLSAYFSNISQYFKTH